MAYCTTAEVREMVKDDALNTIIGDSYIEDPVEREQKIAALTASAIDDAEGEIDGYLSKRYPVPLTTVPKMMNKLCKDIAVYNLFSRIGIEESGSDKNYLNRYNAAIRFLENVASGKVDIGISNNNQTAASSGFTMKSSPRLMSRDSLRGM